MPNDVPQSQSVSSPSVAVGDKTIFNKVLSQSQTTRQLECSSSMNKYAAKHLRVSPNSVCSNRDKGYLPVSAGIMEPWDSPPPNQSSALFADSRELPCHFSQQPKSVLIVKRRFSDRISAIAQALAEWLKQEWNVSVIVEVAGALEYHHEHGQYEESAGKKRPAKSDEESQDSLQCQIQDVDFVVSLGGDGTTLWVSSLFPEVVPPLVGLTLGSLSYLNQFNTDEMLDVLKEMLSGQTFTIQLRSRLYVVVLDEDDEPLHNSHCVNECVVDRGSSSSMALVDVWVNDKYFTTVTADGLILATPTGSTAYSMSAGGAMVHPNVPGILFTPICPHSLSMRPLVLPDNAVLRLKIPDGIRGSLWVSLDGHSRRKLFKGQSVLISLSPFPFPLVCKNTCHFGDAWLQALTDNLNWGMKTVRKRQTFDSTDSEKEKGVVDNLLPPSLREWYVNH